MYFFTRLSRRGEDWPQFLDLPTSVVAETQLIYVQRHANLDIVQPTDFQVGGG